MLTTSQVHFYPWPIITLKLFVNFMHEKVKRKVPGGEH